MFSTKSITLVLTVTTVLKMYHLIGCLEQLQDRALTSRKFGRKTFKELGLKEMMHPFMRRERKERLHE